VTRNYSLVAIALVAAVGLSACASRRNAQMAAQTPDEFLTVARAPLVLPPDYALRPPTPGEPRPQELNPEASARSALGGQRTTMTQGSQGEQLLMAKANADAADPRIKEVIDDEQGDLAHKSESFVNRLLFAAPQAPAPNATALDAEAEARRLQGLTGGQPVTIPRTPPPPEKRGFKLPGL